mmetsp:Transcript_67932/g.196730  ORF Transcript_67932/g.196730 Transcript_67932/m.196730 type:complete len:271 (-) Transcript_67932:1893-2705(-)
MPSKPRPSPSLRNSRHCVPASNRDKCTGAAPVSAGMHSPNRTKRYLGADIRPAWPSSSATCHAEESSAWETTSAVTSVWGAACPTCAAPPLRSVGASSFSDPGAQSCSSDTSPSASAPAATPPRCARLIPARRSSARTGNRLKGSSLATSSCCVTVTSSPPLAAPGLLPRLLPAASLPLLLCWLHPQAPSPCGGIAGKDVGRVGWKCRAPPVGLGSWGLCAARRALGPLDNDCEASGAREAPTKAPWERGRRATPLRLGDHGTRRPPRLM